MLDSTLSHTSEALNATEAEVALTTKPEDSTRTDLKVSCGSCIGACCLKGLVLDLTATEANFLQAAGTELSVYTEPRPKRSKAPKHTSAYELMSDCGNLVDGINPGQKDCAAYEDLGRPRVCDVFQLGSFTCRQQRYFKNVQNDESLRFERWLKSSWS